MRLNKKHIILLTASFAVLATGTYFLIKFLFFPLPVSATRNKIKKPSFNQIMGIKKAAYSHAPTIV